MILIKRKYQENFHITSNFISKNYKLKVTTLQLRTVLESELETKIL